ncbi:DUF2238 domain-containing protein [Paenibacillus sp. BC26]|uniref:DUF2238 domain-containing protein n=1 Tax=Paenibacillus sp. BC26 TaxID=1881032 RepID=UPI0008F0C3E2|nr:DUF2238 domain-containing protein [Paenibacillus sp. BC26]SFT20061.1 putative membrane protein [Paenibacillus sp. BC26]
MPFRSNRWLQVDIIVFVILWGLLALYPVHVFDWWMENILNLLAIIGFVIGYRYFKFNNLAYTLIMIFVLLHTVGAHYAYGLTPLDRFMHHVFDFKRNQYDRVVHFAFGLLLGYPAVEVLTGVTGLRKGWSYLLVPWLLLGFAAIYEIGEMYVVFVAPAEKGDMFLGAQGDKWDAQHDMEVTLYGAIITMLWLWLYRRNSKKV